MKDLRRGCFLLNLLRWNQGLPLERLLEPTGGGVPHGDLEAVLVLLRASRGGRPRAEEALRYLDGGAAERELAALSELGAGYLTLYDPDFPELLRMVDNPPLILYYRGRFERLADPSVAVVGSRRATPYGRTTSGLLARGLAEAGVTVVSGLARGIDTAAHEAALACPGGRTVAVLGCGIDRVYPPENAALARRIEERGAVVTELPVGAPPRAAHFPFRNRIISGLSRATVVAEADERSGSLITARYADVQDRPVFAVPGDLLRPSCRGSNKLLREGSARWAASAQDVLAGCGLDTSEGVAVEVDVSTAAAAVLELVGEGLVALDALLERCPWDFAEVNRALYELMLRGLVRREAGSAFLPTARGLAVLGSRGGGLDVPGAPSKTLPSLDRTSLI